VVFAAVVFSGVALAQRPGTDTTGRTQSSQLTRPALAIEAPERAKPKAAPAALVPFVGEYGTGSDTAFVLERGGLLWLLDGTREVAVATAMFVLDANGRPVALHAGSRTLRRYAVGTEEGVTFRIKPVRQVEELRREALAMSPPKEPPSRHKADLAELVQLEPGIHLDIRYATGNNFLGTPMYSTARAFMERPAALAVARAHRALAAYGYGLLIHDAYRPWYVTKMFWDATPPAQHEFVADPASGSRHNRGAAVDLTLYDRETGAPIRMTGGYDEFSHRSYAAYPGGTALERWHRDLLRRVMEAQGFMVNPSEWWHFDFQGWRDYPILNDPFEKLR
jgi:D-alanyl-D-alanine dipeptidase